MTYKQQLAQRLVHLGQVAAPFYTMCVDEMNAIHKETGLPNWHLYCLIIEAIGYTVHELSDVTEVSA